MPKLEIWHAVVALAALIGPGLLWVGTKIGVLLERTTRTDRRVDKLEASLTVALDKIEASVTEAIKEGWRHCPMARGDGHK